MGCYPEKWKGYYLTAYGLAVKHGYRGTEEEWLEFLKGADVELRYENGVLQWKHDETEEWHTLDEFTVFQRDIQQKAENAQAAADRADASAEGADAAKERADASAVKADISASGADAAAASASASAALADTAAKRADTSAANADAKAQEAQDAAGAADTAAQGAQTAAGSADTAARGAGAARDAANTAAQNAQGRAREAQEAASAANAAASDADHAAGAANMAATAANTAAQNAQTQGGYAKSQGDRADELLGKIEETDVGGMAADILALQAGKADKSEVEAGLAGKVDAVAGKGLTTEDYTPAEKAKLAGTGPGRRTCRFVVGTSTAGWTASDCDYLCDGVDDQEEINAAIQALPYTGGEIVILDGTYNVTDSVMLDSKNSIYLHGNGPSTKLQYTGHILGRERLISISSSYNTVRDLTLDGGANGQISPYLYCIWLNRSAHNIISGNRFVNGANGFKGIFADIFDYSVISGNLFYDFSYGIEIRNAYGLNITRNVYSNDPTLTADFQEHYAIRVRDCSESCINGNIIHHGGEVSTAIAAVNSDSLIITENVCKDLSGGITFESTCNSMILGNICGRGTGLADDYGEYDNTIWLFGAKNDNNLIAENNILGKNYTVDGGTGNTFINNKFE